MTEFVLSTKLKIPPTRPALVSRARLIETLDNGLHRKVTLLSAPAGFGKTTLIAEWLSGLSAARQDKPRELAWFSLDESDNDVRRFLTYFITALQQTNAVGTEVGNSAIQKIQPTQLPPTEPILAALLNEIAAANTQVVLVLDDYHLIETQSIHEILNFWIENTPPNFHLVLVTREDPPLALPRLRARDEMTELRAANMRFTESEAAQFLNDIMGLGLDQESVAKLEERTEGWITGLQMAALSMRDHADVGGFIENFSGTNRYILDYLLEEVLKNQTPDVQHFLLGTSILKRITAPLCDAVLDTPGQSAAILQYLEQANLFLLPLDDERRWYRYHHLFNDLLNARMQQAYSPEQLAGLHSRAAEWHEHNGMVYAAIYHASMLKDKDWVERLIEQNYMQIFQRSDSAFIRNWTGELSEAAIFTSPRLSIHEAMSRSWIGQLDDAQRMLNEAEKRLQEKEPAPEIQAMFGHLYYVRSRITAMGGDFDKAVELCLTAREYTPTENEGLLGGIGVMLGYGYFLQGDFAGAAETLTETIETGKISGAVNTTIGAYCVLARLYALQGQLHKAYDLYREAEKVILDAGVQNQGAMSIVKVGFAEILYEWNDLDAALENIRRGLELIPLWSKADDIALAHIIHSKILLAQGNAAAAEEAIQIGEQVIHASGVFPEARDAVNAARVRLLLEQENTVMAGHWITSTENRLKAENPFRFENELSFITLARLYAAQNKLDQSLDLLARLETHARTANRSGRLVEILALKALALTRLGESEQANRVVVQSLEMAEPEAYCRTFLDQGQPLQDLLTEALSLVDSTPIQDYISHLLVQFEARYKTPTTSAGFGASSASTLVEPLSEREIEVLALIAEGKTNKEIAGQLIISPGTVKAHTSSIYRKLDVANRTEAVATARQLGILS